MVLLIFENRHLEAKGGGLSARTSYNQATTNDINPMHYDNKILFWSKSLLDYLAMTRVMVTSCVVGHSLVGTGWAVLLSIQCIHANQIE